jgi:hypothetical protein
MPADIAVAERLPETGLVLPAEPIIHMPSLPVSLQIFFNDDLFRRCQTVANYLAKAEGYAPRHLIGKPEACFAVVSRALTWRLDPYAVAQATYQTPNGQVGYYGSLCQAIIENSGRLDPSYGGVKFEHVGDWLKLRVGANGRMFKMATSQRGGDYPVPAWEQWGPLEEGLGVIVRAKLKDEDNPREMPFDLLQAYPRNSTLWATDPRTQICYTSVRRFSTSTVPTLFMGVPFDHETMDDWIASLHDVTPPRPELEHFSETGEPKGGRRSRGPKPSVPGERPIAEDPQLQTHTSGQASPATGNGAAGPTAGSAKVEKPWFFSDEYGEVTEFEDVDEAVTTYAGVLEGRRNNVKALETAWLNGARLLATLRDRGHTEAADALNTEYSRLLEEAGRAEEARKPAATGEPAAATGGPAAATATSEPAQAAASPAYDVAVPLPEGMPMNQWHMAARERLKVMTQEQRPPVDFTRFREVNSTALDRLKGELRSWYNMLDKEITRGAAPPS